MASRVEDKYCCVCVSWFVPTMCSILTLIPLTSSSKSTLKYFIIRIFIFFLKFRIGRD